MSNQSFLSYILSIYGFKLSLLCSYLRFVTTGGFRYAIIAVIVLNTLFHLSFLLVQINLCQPVGYPLSPRSDTISFRS